MCLFVRCVLVCGPSSYVNMLQNVWGRKTVRLIDIVPLLLDRPHAFDEWSAALTIDALSAIVASNFEGLGSRGLGLLDICGRCPLAVSVGLNYDARPSR